MTEIEAIIEEIRQSRRQMSEQCGHDPAVYIEFMKKFDKDYSTQVERYRKEHAAASEETALLNH
jgi:hypothetical protein